MYLIYQVLASFIKAVIIFLDILSWLLVINVLLSFFIAPKHPVRKLLKKVTDPVIDPIRQLTKKYGSTRMPIDIAPMLALIVIWVVSSLLSKLLLFVVLLSY